MKTLSLAVGVLSIVIGIFSSLMVMVFAMAGGANAKPEEVRVIWIIVIAAAIGGILCAGGGIWLVALGKGWWGTLVGGLPTAFIAFMIVYLTFKSS
jgi:hypothetical protein